MPAPGTQPAPYPRLLVRVASTTEVGAQFEFTATFRIGRTDDCEVSIRNEFVSRVHAEGTFENGQWIIRDLDSSNGLYVSRERLERVSITGPTTLRLGIDGPELFLDPEVPQAQPAGASSGGMRSPASGTILRRYVDHYFSKSANSTPAGEHTMYVRRAFAKIQQQQQRRYTWIITGVLLLAVGAGSYALYERRELRRQRALAEDLFYSMKTIDVDIANVENLVSQSGSHQDVESVRAYANRRRQIESNYDQYLAALRIYNSKLTEQQRIMLRIARIFGECELEMPHDFEAEVNKYIKYWQQSDRLANAIRNAQQGGYVDVISNELLAQGLPPQFFYVALQESNFDTYAVGPVTRKGIAKGMWQFIPETAIKYGLRVGPLADLRRPDPGDERDQFPKATKAAARYLKDLYSTDAQASGFLVMACYNWGEGQVLPLVRSMPANPRERNFWRLLSQYRDRIPQETYDYVFYIISAAVIGENPRLFGFHFDNPLANQQRLLDTTPATRR